MENTSENVMNVRKLDTGTEETNHDTQNYKTISIVVFTIEFILVVLGLTGNSLCFAVTVKTNLRKMSSAVYLSVSAICDNLLMYITIMRTLIPSNLWLGKDTARLHVALCLSLEFMNYWVSQLSSWCLVAFTIERAVAVLFPHRHELFCFNKILDLLKGRPTGQVNLFQRS